MSRPAVRRPAAPPPLPDIDLDALLKRLHLANARRAWRDLLLRAEQEEWTYEYLLTILVSEEIAHRQQTRLGRLCRRAGFPFLKTIDDFNFTYQSTLRLALLGSALSPDFVTEGRALILVGKPGRGKTHLAVAIAYRAIQNGFDARFVTAAELIDDLSAAFRAGQLAEALTRYTHPNLLVVDEVGYLTYGTDAANMLFHVVNDRHRRKRAMIFTTNKPLSAWGRVLHDEDLAQAIVDRVLERGRLLMLDGPSLRTKHLGLDDPTAATTSPQVASISGIRAPEFPEPTRGPQGSPRAPVPSPERWHPAQRAEVCGAVDDGVAATISCASPWGLRSQEAGNVGWRVGAVRAHLAQVENGARARLALRYRGSCEISSPTHGGRSIASSREASSTSARTNL